MLWLPNPTLGASVKNQILCFEKQNFCLSDSEFNFAETKIANFWQREHPVGDFSLVRFFWSSKEMNRKYTGALGAALLSQSHKKAKNGLQRNPFLLHSHSMSQ